MCNALIGYTFNGPAVCWEIAEKQGEEAGFATPVGPRESEVLAGKEAGMGVREQESIAAPQADVA